MLDIVAYTKSLPTYKLVQTHVHLHRYLRMLGECHEKLSLMKSNFPFKNFLLFQCT